MANIGRIALSGLSTALESTQTLANFNFDFSLVKVDPPREFHDLGLSLTNTRRETAEEGSLHITARRLGAIFAPLLPETPNLIRCYGLRSSEIARESSQIPSPTNFGIFTPHVGIDGTSIWAGATSGINAIQVHLLACLLARIWTGPEAISVWFELLKSRRDRIQAQIASMDSVEINSILAAKQDISRDELAEWDASARAWLRIADSTRRLQQKQLLLIIGNMDAFVNSRPGLYDSVMKAWITSLESMEGLLSGSPLDMRTGDLPLALASWHLYPNLNLVGPVTKVVDQHDPLFPESGILTLGLQGPECDSQGLRWSLPLAHFRFYGGPIQRSRAVRSEGARLDLDEFNMAVLGCILCGWRVKEDESEEVITWISRLSKAVITSLTSNGLRDDVETVRPTWLSILGASADAFLKSQGLERSIFLRLLKLGRRYSNFIGEPRHTFFGLCKLESAVTIARNSEEKVTIFRSHASRVGLPWDHAIIRYVSDSGKQIFFASAAVIPRINRKRDCSEEPKETKGHVRWIGQRVSEKHEELPIDPIKHDAFVGSADPSLDHRQPRAVRKARGRPPKPRPNTTLVVSGTPSRLIPAAPQVVAKSEAPLAPEVVAESEDKERAYITSLGEELRYASTEPLEAHSLPSKPMRVVWGEPARPAVADWDAYEHWFGEMKHYQLWLGNTESAAIFIRLDQSSPKSDSIPFAKLAALFEQKAFRSEYVAEELVRRLEEDDPKYLAALKCLATMNSTYQGLNEATIDVHVLERCLVDTQWCRSLNFLEHEDDDKVNPETETKVPSDVEYESPRNSQIHDESFFEREMEILQPFEDEQDSLAAAFSNHHKGNTFETLRRKLQPINMSIEESFSSILFFESSFDVSPNEVSNVMAMSTGNSLFIAACLLCDPAKPLKRGKIRHIMGNVGKPGISLLVPPLEPRMMKLEINQWYLIDRAKWDGMARDSFSHSTLHLWFTGKNQEINTGYSGTQDRELYFLESAVSLYGGKGEWVADLDILKMLEKSPFVYKQDFSRSESAVTRLRDSGDGPGGPVLACHGKHVHHYRYENLPLVSIENWPELIHDENVSSIFMATGNWQARLAVAMICAAQKRRVCLLQQPVCWQCIEAKKDAEECLSDPTVYVY